MRSPFFRGFLCPREKRGLVWPVSLLLVLSTSFLSLFLCFLFCLYVGLVMLVALSTSPLHLSQIPPFPFVFVWNRDDGRHQKQRLGGRGEVQHVSGMKRDTLIFSDSSEFRGFVMGVMTGKPLGMGRESIGSRQCALLLFVLLLGYMYLYCC